MLFWCWRDEVFGREAGGFGISGNDGYAAERLAAMAKTGAIAERNRNLLEDMRVDPTEVGVLFSPQSYYLTWCQEGGANTSMKAIRTYCRALNRRQIPYTVIEEEHLDELKGIRVLFMPRVNVLDAKTEKALEEFLNRGGVLFTESECGAFDSVGIWRYPEDRFTARMTGVRELGRRQLIEDGLVVDLDGDSIEVNAAQWLTPLDASKGKVLCSFNDSTGTASLLTHAAAGAGSIYLCGTFLGNSDTPDAAMDHLVDHVVRRSSVVPPLEIVDPSPQSGRRVQVSIGKSGNRRMVFLFAPEGTETIQFRIKEDRLGGASMQELLQDKAIVLQREDGWLSGTVEVNEWGIAVLVEN